MMRTDSAQIIIGHETDISPEIRGGEHFSFMARWRTALGVEGGTGRAIVVRTAIEYMRRSKTGIAEIPITERPVPRNGLMNGTTVAQNDTHVAIATAPNTIVVLDRAAVTGVFEIGKRVRIRFRQGRGTLEYGRDRGR